ncbi:hypothetical protein [Flammeovirga aprica]|uniref:Lipoprotein n=1 Tax=Flammeovirga aprica JL-4 TaxID=694437 RepID=A0A7X9S1C3_9BACT|nr:hypothetical protein [Flammeovirga aprica]NME72563.1 hypothetical protein [Flammeovirga aprica JL-4]
MLKTKLLMILLLCLSCQKLSKNNNFYGIYSNNYQKIFIHENGVFTIVSDDSYVPHPIEICDTISIGTWEQKDSKQLLINSKKRTTPTFFLNKEFEQSSDSLYFVIKYPLQSFRFKVEILINKERIVTVSKDYAAIPKKRYLNSNIKNLIEIYTIPYSGTESHIILSDSINTELNNYFLITMPIIDACHFDYMDYINDTLSIINNRRIMLKEKIYTKLPIKF